MKNKKIKFGILMMGATMALIGCTQKGQSDEITTQDDSEIITLDDVNTSELSTEIVSTEGSTDSQGSGENMTPDDVAGYTIERMDAMMQVVEGVNVRSGPDKDFDWVGSIIAEETVLVTGRCKETGWYQVKFGDLTGFVSNEYLVSEEETESVILGDECPYPMLVKMTYEGQIGWFYRVDGQSQPDNYEELVKEITETDGYKIPHVAVYVGGWHDVGDVMWVGYSKE